MSRLLLLLLYPYGINFSIFADNLVEQLSSIGAIC